MSLERSRRFEVKTFADEMQEKWEKAKAMYARKVAKIPTRIFPGGSKPTIKEIFQVMDTRYDCDEQDLYDEQHVLYPVNIPPKYSLKGVLKHFSDIEADGFKPRKLLDHHHVVGYVWYWQLDQNHSFSRKHIQVLANVIVASIVGAGDADKKTHEWADRFVRAFMAYNNRNPDTSETEHFLGMWWRSNWDLIKFGRAKLELIKAKIREARSRIPNTPFHPFEYPELAKEQDRTAFLKNAGMWAIWWHLDNELTYNGLDTEFKGNAANAFLESNDMLEAFGSSSVSDGVPDYVSHAQFNKPFVKCLMEDIREDHPWKQTPEAADAARRKPWMDENDAVDLILGNKFDELIGGMQLQ
ncbi:hypothetical protein P171DRAFT_490173 [Karstenula rhodostoma CBS 690.94]|uniref:Uncharacterized protein n=1 Tax=Karstenula rhodostoma CBS 690.94 TaxID=1392251 RepID=A0A9P4P8X8_9PLEO|nr:hypothetical protein P171DRAFT_490173 [Karstenula rhodostoma CBS 690.94]